MFYDWLRVYQDFEMELPLIGDTLILKVDAETNELQRVHQPVFRHEGSFSTSVAITISGTRITMDGNPSRLNRLDNLIGYSTLDACMSVFNSVLSGLGLPAFTKCTKTFRGQSEDGKRSPIYSDGATITRVDIASNVCTGQHAGDYIKGVSTQRYGYAEPNLFTNGHSVDWRTAMGGASSRKYHKLYDKAHEFGIHAFKRIKARFAPETQEYKYGERLHAFLKEQGVCRFETEFKSQFLRENNFRFWGLFDETDLKAHHEEFTRIDQKLEVESMDLQSISERLYEKGICPSTRASMTTALYAIEWMHGKRFDFSKKQVQTHRGRLRKIGIDIKNEYDHSRFSPVYVKKAKRVDVTPLITPPWYRQPANLTLRAA